ncbi:MAG: iron-containing alcohol dehydrogenase [Oscillospiraceae bacterium]|nr:iron-containing alcohol dehydrogenase [Oscillospiraceae bacterium]
MNPLEKLVCRTVQTVFRLAIPLLPYRQPTILKHLADIPAQLTADGVTAVLLVTDPDLRRLGSTAALETLLAEAGIHCAVYDRTRPNPTVHNVEEAREVYVREGCQALIAFGGGSSMDCAKAVGARIAYPNRSLNGLKGLLRVLRRIPTLYAVPTTAGTGSEVTITAVITDPDAKHKYTMNDFALIPAYAVLDPEVTFTLPPHLTASTGMDALTHVVEAYIGRSTTQETRAMALDTVRLIFTYLERAYADGRDRKARAMMLRAAYQAGLVFSKSYVGYIHAVAHSLGGQYNIPHGLANAVLIPMVLEAYGPAAEKKLHELAVAAGVSDGQDTDADGAAKFIRAIRDMNRRMGIPETLEGIRTEDIPRMARFAAKEANPLYPVPVLWNARELERFYHEVSSERLVTTS